VTRRLLGRAYGVFPMNKNAYQPKKQRVNPNKTSNKLQHNSFLAIRSSANAFESMNLPYLSQLTDRAVGLSSFF
jgi:hypothetical protein